MKEEKENFDLEEDNLCSLMSSNDEDDEEDDVFSAVQGYSYYRIDRKLDWK